MSQRASSMIVQGEAQPVADPAAARCNSCGTEQPAAPLCRDCGRVISLPPDADHYQVFGMARHLDLDLDDLSRRYYDLSRSMHPDRHAVESAEAREASLRNTAALTRAYRDLRDPISRAGYWLELHGEKIGDDNRVPPELAALVFEVQERLEELRAATGAARQKLEQEVREELESLRQQDGALLRDLQTNFQRWDDGTAAAELIPQLKSILRRRAYLATLLRDVAATLQDDRET